MFLLSLGNVTCSTCGSPRPSSSSAAGSAAGVPPAFEWVLVECSTATERLVLAAHGSADGPGCPNDRLLRVESDFVIVHIPEGLCDGAGVWTMRLS